MKNKEKKKATAQSKPSYKVVRPI